MIYAAAIILYLTFIRMVVTLVNLLTLHRQKQVTHGEEPLVSILIPARNEEANIGTVLDSLLRQNYKNYEIVVCNDASTDTTEAILNEYSQKNKKVRYINAPSLPDGWLGKNHSCHLLSTEAVGEYLLFIDADVTAADYMLQFAVERMQRKRLALLSLFPMQLTLSRGERVVVPVMNWILLSLLPLFLVKACRWTSFSAANGQFMMFRASIYRKHWFHKMVRSSLTEDIVLARTIKKMRLPVETLMSRGEVSCRMYGSYREALNGFAKNVITMFGDSLLFISFFMLLLLGGWIVVFGGLGWIGLAVYVFMAAIINLSVAAAGKQSLKDALLLFPERVAAMTFIYIRALKVRYGKRYTWKGRTVEVGG
jgi:glycosyltransferase involved in cell wall biosynthesis